MPAILHIAAAWDVLAYLEWWEVSILLRFVWHSSGSLDLFVVTDVPGSCSLMFSQNPEQHAAPVNSHLQILVISPGFHQMEDICCFTQRLRLVPHIPISEIGGLISGPMLVLGQTTSWVRASLKQAVRLRFLAYPTLGQAYK